MPTTITRPDDLLDWLSAMRDAGDVAPVLAVIRDGRLLASGFVSPPYDRAVAAAMYGFAADVAAVAVDMAVTFSADPPAVPPVELLAAGDPDTHEAMYVQWLPRSGEAQVWQRRYRTGADRIDWEPVELVEAAVTGPAYVSPVVLADTLERLAREDLIRARVRRRRRRVSQAWRDQTTAGSLGLELWRRR